MSVEKKITFALIVLVGLIALVNCADNRQPNENRLKLLRRGIILKCQGNPVSCYGKRSSSVNEEQAQQPEAVSSSEDLDGLNEEQQELNLERQYERLIHGCRLGNEKSCSTILKVMLMNSN